jgi:hypothetical protein
MADPDKWEPLIARIEKRLEQTDTLLALNDKQAMSVEEVVREARVIQKQIGLSAIEATRRFQEEAPLEQTLSTQLAELINGERYDPRQADFRRGVKAYSRPVYDAVTRARISFGDHSGLLPDEILKFGEQPLSLAARIRKAILRK